MNDTHVIICKEFLRSSHVVKIALSELAESHGLTLQQIFVLNMLRDNNGLVMGDVAQRMHCDASNVTGIIDRLAVQNIVQRQEDPEDRRAKKLRITPKGEQIMKEIETNLPERAGFTRFTATEIDQLSRLLTKLSS